MWRVLSVIAWVIAVLALSGCATMNRPQCETSDWRTVGFEDGSRGNPVAKIGDYRKACAKYSVSPDFESYRAGHAEGVETYCREGNGFNVGARGGSYDGVCPAEYEGRFLTGYRTGRHLYELNSAVDEAAHRLAHRRGELEDARNELIDRQAAVLDKETPRDERAALIVEIAELGRQIGALEKEIPQLEREVGFRRNELADFRESLAYDP